MARPVCKGFCRDRRLISLLQRIRPRRSPPGQDGDTRAPVILTDLLGRHQGSRRSIVRERWAWRWRNETRFPIAHGRPKHPSASCSRPDDFVLLEQAINVSSHFGDRQRGRHRRCSPVENSALTLSASINRTPKTFVDLSVPSLIRRSIVLRETPVARTSSPTRYAMRWTGSISG
jgi:hypothetical protein